jgi:Zn ribbon nucleic-acid-binding protein
MPEVLEHRIYATYHCDDCPDGRMYPTGNLWASDKIEHRCMTCGSYQNFPTCYDRLWKTFAGGPDGQSES